MADGSRVRLGDIAPGDRVITRTGRPGTVIAVHEQGVLPVIRITTHAGRTVRSAYDHPFLTPNGWKDAADLAVGDTLGSVSMPAVEPPDTTLAETAHYRLAGYLIGDGHVNNGHATFTNVDPPVLVDFLAQVERLGFSSKDATGSRRATTYVLSGGVRQWLRDRGIAGHVARTKRVPSFVMTSDANRVAHFIGAYFTCDGCVSGKGWASGRRDVAVELYSVSTALLTDIQHLLLRFGIQSRLRYKKVRYRYKATDEIRDSYVLTLCSTDDVAKFRDRIPVVGAKRDRLDVAACRRTTFEEPILPDAIAAIEPDGKAACRCLTLAPDDDPTFTVNDLIVHNTRLVSELFPAWFMARKPGRQVIIASYGAALAELSSKRARDLFAHPDWPFEGVRLAKDATSVSRWQTNTSSILIATGVGGAATGFGAHALIVDDPHKGRDEADSEVYRDRAWEWWLEVARTRLMPGGSIVLCQTRWHSDDLAGRILNSPGASDWTVLSLPALAEPDDPLGRAPGDPLWPAWFTRDALETIRRDLTTQKGSRAWWALYQQRPQAAEGNIFRRDWLGLTYPEPPAERREQCRRVVLAVDAAFKTGISNDRSALVVLGSDDAVLDVLHVRAERLEYPDLRRAIIMAAAQWKPNVVVIEDTAAGQSVIQELRQTTTLPIVAVSVRASKQARAEAVTGLFETGKVRFPAVSVPWVADAIDELAAFPSGLHDDVVDALVHALTRLAQFSRRRSFGPRDLVLRG